jgi:hypothetical protein
MTRLVDAPYFYSADKDSHTNATKAEQGVVVYIKDTVPFEWSPPIISLAYDLILT